MEQIDLKPVNQSYCYDDSTLQQKYQSIIHVTEERKNCLEQSLHHSAEHDYIRVAICRLAYSFAKEEQDTLREEMRNRGLIT